MELVSLERRGDLFIYAGRFRREGGSKGVAMDAILWKERITDSCKSAGTYQTFFDDLIEILADIMERRDIALGQWKKTKKTLANYTNKGGNKNTVVHPQLKVVQDCESSALAYWRELGLTPASFKKLTETEVKQIRQMDPLSAAIKDLDFNTEL